MKDETATPPRLPHARGAAHVPMLDGESEPTAGTLPGVYHGEVSMMKHWNRIAASVFAILSSSFLIASALTPNNQDKEIDILYAIAAILFKIAWTEK